VGSGGAIGDITGGALPTGQAQQAPRGAAPAHAEGGLVQRPAPGEVMASVAPGELIVPAQQAREITGGGIGPRTREAMAQPANGNGGGVHIDHLALTITAPNGVTDATSLSVVGLSLALERYQLASGR
jgi:hypothetical protein